MMLSCQPPPPPLQTLEVLLNISAMRFVNKLTNKCDSLVPNCPSQGVALDVCTIYVLTGSGTTSLAGRSFPKILRGY